MGKGLFTLCYFRAHLINRYFNLTLSYTITTSIFQNLNYIHISQSCAGRFETLY